MSFGILARDAGMGVVAPIVMSLTTFAGSAQMAAATVMQDGGAVAAAVAAAILLNLRYMAIGVSVAPSLRGRRGAQAGRGAARHGRVVGHRPGPRARQPRAMLGAGLVLLVAWTAGTVAGVFGGSALGDPATYGFDAMFPALFLALLVGQLGDGRARAAALAGALIALILTPVAPPGVPIIAAAAGALIALKPPKEAAA